MHRLNLEDDEVRKQLGAALERVVRGHERLTLTRDGEALAAVVSLADLAVLQRLEDEGDLDDVRRTFAEAGDEPPIAWTALKHELNL